MLTRKYVHKEYWKSIAMHAHAHAYSILFLISELSVAAHTHILLTHCVIGHTHLVIATIKSFIHDYLQNITHARGY